MRYYNREERGQVELLNLALGTQYRSKPYDLTRKEDLIHAMTMAAAEYADYYIYSCELEQLEESFDESLECFDPITWLGMAQDEDGRDSKRQDDEDLVRLAMASLSEASIQFSELSERAEGKCRDIWMKGLLSNVEGVHEHFFGDKLKLDADMLTKAFDSLFKDEPPLFDQATSIPERTKVFAERLLEEIRYIQKRP